MKFVGKWMELENIILHEIFQSKEENATVLPCMQILAVNLYMLLYNWE